MPATMLLTNPNLKFGVPTLANVVLQEIKSDRNANTAKATGEKGEVIGIAIYGGQDTEGSGSYLFLGTAFGGGIGNNIASSVGSSLNLTGPCCVTGFGINRTNEGFATGDFKFVSLDSASVSTQ
jgi:hypothetical protein